MILDRVSNIVKPDNTKVSYSYDRNGDLVQFIDEDGGYWNYKYDDNHNLISIRNPRGIEVLKTAYEKGNIIKESYNDKGVVLGAAASTGYSSFIGEIIK